MKILDVNMVIIMCNPVMKKLWSKLLDGYLSEERTEDKVGANIEMFKFHHICFTQKNDRNV